MEFMYFVYVIITLIVARTTWPLLPLTVRAKVIPTSGMSVASKHLYREYQALPQDSRPFPDVARVLRQLDERFAVDQAALNNHFKKSSFRTDETYKFSWTDSQGRCHHSKCKYGTEVGRGTNRRRARGSYRWRCRYGEGIDRGPAPRGRHSDAGN
jgi:hypothetical protein